MIRKKLLFLALLCAAGTCFAQDKEKEKDLQEYHLNLPADSSVLDAKSKEKLTKAFYKIYPDFARANSYHTKKHLSVTFADSPAITAEDGKMEISAAVVKDLSEKKLEKAMEAALAKNWASADTIKKKGFQLVFINKNQHIDPAVQQSLIDTYFEIFPVLIKTFNKKTTKSVVFVTDTAYGGVAEASGNRILFSTKYLKAHPTDIDVVTHETMHLVQGYGYSAGPVWLTEGIADYVRYKYGVDNVGSKWYLPAFNSKQSYTNSYRITARFFVWLEKNVKPGLIADLDVLLRAHQYNDQSWVTLTGKNLDALWEAYSQNPAVELTYSDKAKLKKGA
ncbi:basic secretory protein-like protein [Mucilaginibacter rubeus]|uniref:Secretory protein n=1 Tax=Mucilaginibacter rubeus TaxID=2027860 RepID=A0A5C1HU24_9SPHI|nr:basic secretory protein-like protein [Mucilaginibacter rubeus]QEM08560.1 secretory protein [Mucilaginibacter rubeus]